MSLREARLRSFPRLAHHTPLPALREPLVPGIVKGKAVAAWSGLVAVKACLRLESQAEQAVIGEGAEGAPAPGVTSAGGASEVVQLAPAALSTRRPA